MPVLPNSNLAMIEWFEQRLASWSGDPAAIGLTMAQTTDLLAKTSTARAGYMAAQQARNESKSATVNFHTGANDLRGFGADLIKTIKAFAEASEDPNVYVLADVPPPAPPSPLGAPGTPFDITISLNSVGQMQLAWKADNAAASTGAYFVLERRLNNDPSFTMLGASGAKSFVDNSIPLGTSQATYVITPFRGDLAGLPSQQFTVQFGVDVPMPGGETTGEEGLHIAA